MLGLAMKENRNNLLKSLQTEHILVIPAGENVVRFLPSFIIEKKHVDQVLFALEKILATFS